MKSSLESCSESIRGHNYMRKGIAGRISNVNGVD